MGTYRKEWPCCDSVTETQAWEPESCPFCTPDAAPAAANGALTDAKIQDITMAAVKSGDVSWSHYQKDANDKYTIPQLAPYHFQFARAILAAAGPNAALVKALEKIMDWHLSDNWGSSDDIGGRWQHQHETIAAALSGAKGN